MFEAHSISTEHRDLIHDVAYDFYGQRMATCSSDQFVKVIYGLALCGARMELYGLFCVYHRRYGTWMSKKTGI